MTSAKKPFIFVVEDDADIRELLARSLAAAGYEYAMAADPVAARPLLEARLPDVILLDVMMPRMNGYDFCSKLRDDERLSAVPVIFMTALDSERDKARAFAVGAADFLTKPIVPQTLRDAIARHLKSRTLWTALDAEAGPIRAAGEASQLHRFKAFLGAKIGAENDPRLKAATFDGLYAAAVGLGLTRERVARLIAEHQGLNYLAALHPESIRLGVLPAKFSQQHQIVAIVDESGAEAFVLANPFQTETMSVLRQNFGGERIRIFIAEPEKISSVLRRRSREEVARSIASGDEEVSATDMGEHIIETAVLQRASDIHIEPKSDHAVVRFRIDGELRDAMTIKNESSLRIVSRFKALAELDVAERRRPQDGAMTTAIDGRAFIIRLATTSTPSGESLVMRLLEPWAKAKSLAELGMTDSQVEDMMGFARRQQGLVLLAGPTGSGKTTTIYSLLQHIDCSKRSLVSIEDPVEYRIPAANQQQVDEKAGMTFEALLKSAVRQDPDILFLGEMRDQYSSKMAVDFSSTGHLTISTVHTANATTAIFRLERVGITRGAMADSILGVIAQKLVKRLCPHCKKTAPITEEEAGWLAPFTLDVPVKVAHPVGCEKCGGTGYHGREGVYEIVKFYPEISDMIRRDAPISEIRDFAHNRGDYLIGQHAVEKVRGLICSPKLVYEQVLLEEVEYKRNAKSKPPPSRLSPEPAVGEKSERIGKPLPADAPPVASLCQGRILVVEDDQETRELILRLLRPLGYEVIPAADGVEALMLMGREKLDLILSDIDMPNLDGLKLMELKLTKGIDIPVVFLTARSDEEIEFKALNLGAADYIRKPVGKEILALRIRAALKHKTN